MAEYLWLIIPLTVFVALAVILAVFGGGTGAEQINIEFFFRLLYDCLHGACYGGALAKLMAFLAELWLVIIILGYILAAAGLFFIVYLSIRLYELRKREEEVYGTVLVAPSESAENPRWKHIQSLMESDAPSAWREAIIEADIMLDDMLSVQGYQGESIGDKLKLVERSDFASINDAWEAHKVRNQIAHEGSSFDLPESLARRTIARYEAVFREFEAI